MAMLSDPLMLPCGARLPNRIAKSAMSEQLGDRQHAPTAALATLYRRWSEGGAGLVITGNVMIDHSALGEPRNVVVADERHLDGLRRWAQAGTVAGNHLWMQINHPGRQSPRLLSSEPVAPSAVPLQLPGGMFAPPRALTGAEIVHLIDRFGRTARIAQQAGFTGIQIHAAHGYLISQFLSPLTNLRSDEWGGSPEKRRRFLIEIVRRVRTAVGPDFPIGVKLNSADFQRGGFGEEEAIEVARALEHEQIDLLEISGGTYEQPSMMDVRSQRASTRQREAYFLAFARQVRERVQTPLMLTGGFRTARTMSEALREGAIDVVGLARPLAVDPAFPQRLLSDPEATGVAPLRPIGIHHLDVLLNTQWYTQQLHRMGHGHDPQPDYSPWLALLWTVWANGWNAFTRRLG